MIGMSQVVGSHSDVSKNNKFFNTNILVHSENKIEIKIKEWQVAILIQQILEL
jgi:hypothetical protein